MKIPCDGGGQHGAEHGLIGAICIGCDTWQPVDSKGLIPPHDRELTASEALDRHIHQFDSANGQ